MIESRTCIRQCLQGQDILFKIERGKEISHGFFSSDQFNGTVFPEQQFFRAEFRIIVKTHGMTMSPCVMNDENIIWFNSRKFPLNGELVNVFTKGSDNIDFFGREICRIFS